MQNPDQTNGVSFGPTTRGTHSSKPSLGGELTGFSHGAFSSNQPIGGFQDRNSQRANIPSINTGRLAQVGQISNEMQSPATAWDVNFTPLLPSQLLLGSPFQPGSPSTFTSPQFQNFSTFTPQSHAAQQRNQPNQMASPTQPHQQMSPQMYSNVLSTTGMGASSYYGGLPSPTGGAGMMAGNFGSGMGIAPGLMSNTSRTVYLGNIPADTSAEEILGHVRSGQIESVRLLPDKSCAFISFLDGSSATHFHSDAILKKLSIRGQDIKIGWGKPSQVPTSVALAVQQSGASRNVYLGNLPTEISEDEIREDLSKFGPIDTVKMVREKSIAFVHFLSVGNAVKAVTQLPQEPNWQPPRRVFYGKDRCAYVSKTQQQNAAQYLGIAPGYAHVLNSADRDLISNALAQQSVAAAAVATAAGGVNNLGNRTVYLGNIHPETTIEEICNVVRGGLLHHVRYIPDKHICFVTFIDPTSAASFYALSNMQGLMIHNRRLKIGWGKHSGALPPAIALAVSGGASRNVYVGNLDETWSEERLRQDFSEYGEIELVNTLREKSCAFVNFTNIANAIKAIEGVRGKDDYKRFKINFGKDRCGNAPRQINHNQNNQNQNGQTGSQDGLGSPSPNGGLQPSHSSQTGSAVSPANSILSPNGIQNQGPNGVVHAPTPSAILNAGSNNPLTMFLNQMSNQHLQYQQQQQSQLREQQLQQQQVHHQPQPSFEISTVSEQPRHHQRNSLSTQRSSIFGGLGNDTANAFSRQPALELPRQQNQYVPGHAPSNSFSVNHTANGVSSTIIPTIGGMLAPSSMTAAQKAQHARTLSLPAFSQGPFGQLQNPQHSHQSSQNNGFAGLSAYLSGYASSGSNGGFGLAIQGDGGLPGWAEEDVAS